MALMTSSSSISTTETETAVLRHNSVDASASTSSDQTPVAKKAGRALLIALAALALSLPATVFGLYVLVAPLLFENNQRDF
jgi:hypothetical protein